MFTGTSKYLSYAPPQSHLSDVQLAPSALVFAVFPSLAVHWLDASSPSFSSPFFAATSNGFCLDLRS
jgi:hypothetical protein